MSTTGTNSGMSSYDRPDRQWRCGRLALGQPCPHGPDAAGACRGMADCAPIRRGDRWHCTRPQSVGGPCDAGPAPDGRCSFQRPPCVPVRSLSALRRRVTRLVVVAAIGLVMIGLSGTDREALLSPGPLTFQHSVVGGCAGCHQGFDEGPAGWVMTAVGMSQEMNGDHTCRSCHELGPHAERAHSRPPATTAALTDAALHRHTKEGAEQPLEFKLSGWLFTDTGTPTSTVGCATCHREHSGVDASLTEMPEGACQTCHTVQFNSFGNGHPEFGETLFDRRLRIAFDHAAHLDRHFGATESAGKAPETCTSCHLPSDDGRAMQTEKFETMCASCHQDNISGAGAIGPKGIAFLTVPGLDLQELTARGVDIGDWPKWSEEPLTPFMRRLLEGDSSVTLALERMDGLDPMDLRDAEADDIRAVTEVAFAVKRLIGDLLADGVQAAEKRLANGRTDKALEQISTDQTGTMLGHLPMEVLQAAARNWFPELASELAGKLPALPETIPGPPSAQNGSPTPAPSLDQSDILASAPDQSDILAAPTTDQSDILAPAPDQSDILAAPSTDQSDILALPLTGTSDALAPPPELAPTSPVTRAETAPPPTRIEPNVSPEDWMRAGGWYRNDFALLYRPTGHADPFMQAWIDLAAAPSPQDGDGALLATFAGAQAPGTCLRCHSVDRGEGGTGSVNWHPASRDPATRDFVRFSHRPHFSLIAESGGCQTCHNVIRPKGTGSVSAFQDQYRQSDPHAEIVAGFASPTVATCSECHAPGRAGDTCTQCHAYHVGTFETPTVPTRMRVLAPTE
ncbi:hypothetical protein [Nisaea nitritireducens]|uniref:hypothetical protein n=1 Tax=Nisaea nitritireducens TaxID=568392 RepID=UPI0018682CD6|nr:hypothetical protein [Nisaea nitritireducens]